MADLTPKVIDSMPITKELSSDKKGVLMFHFDLPDRSMKWSSPEVTLQKEHQGRYREENWA